MKTIIKTPQEMFDLGQQLGKEYKKILLYGDLGSGKTLLTKGFAKSLGIDENAVQSPTYAYINSYNNKLLHMDMYRIDSEGDIWEKGFNDQISNHEYISIEWPKFVDILDIDDYVKIYITKDGDSRVVEIK
ncbi:MAG TPA: tRNA (adenosine(37)-N6)-threonylcarbamoyltransferase complex ATPase subunit type 1 TsaE [Candidatus Absconditabacterales bacterium]|nr:tRNA (adenosine(37)-N6)-threonylcarbamoyltransferase complex ATPase subunit type 1 TsaE [Candidatus Absconditabacterales bacterium]